MNVCEVSKGFGKSFVKQLFLVLITVSILAPKAAKAEPLTTALFTGVFFGFVSGHIIGKNSSNNKKKRLSRPIVRETQDNLSQSVMPAPVYLPERLSKNMTDYHYQINESSLIGGKRIRCHEVTLRLFYNDGSVKKTTKTLCQENSQWSIRGNHGEETDVARSRSRQTKCYRVTEVETKFEYSDGSSKSYFEKRCDDDSFTHTQRTPPLISVQQDNSLCPEVMVIGKVRFIDNKSCLPNYLRTLSREYNTEYQFRTINELTKYLHVNNLRLRAVDLASILLQVKVEKRDKASRFKVLRALLPFTVTDRSNIIFNRDSREYQGGDVELIQDAFGKSSLDFQNRVCVGEIVLGEENQYDVCPAYAIKN